VVNLNYNIWIEHCHHPFDVPTPQRIEERAGNLSLLNAVNIRLYGRTLHPVPRATCKLPRRIRGTSYDRCNFIKRYGEYVMQHEC
jgi:hypothetical protein